MGVLRPLFCSGCARSATHSIGDEICCSAVLLRSNITAMHRVYSLVMLAHFIAGLSVRIQIPVVAGPDPSGGRAGPTRRTVPGVSFGCSGMVRRKLPGCFERIADSATRCKRSLVCSLIPIGDAALAFWPESSAWGLPKQFASKRAPHIGSRRRQPFASREHGRAPDIIRRQP